MRRPDVGRPSQQLVARRTRISGLQVVGRWPAGRTASKSAAAAGKRMSQRRTHISVNEPLANRPLSHRMRHRLEFFDRTRSMSFSVPPLKLTAEDWVEGVAEIR